MATARPTFGAFNQGVIPTIACFIDKTAKTPLGVEFGALVAAMQRYVNQHVAPVWGTPAKLVKSKGFIKDAWAVVFLDDADQPGDIPHVEHGRAGAWQQPGPLGRIRGVPPDLGRPGA